LKKQKWRDAFQYPKDSYLLILALIVYIPLIFLGYGSDYDSYNVLWVGKNFVETLDYVPSRVPGFFVFETITYFLNLIGGSVLTNLGSLVMSVTILSIFMYLCRKYAVPHYQILTIILITHPYYLVNSTCTMDYLFAFGFALIGLWMLMEKKYVPAGLALALGIGSRLTTGLVAGLFLLWMFLIDKTARKKIILSGILTAVFTFLFYLPPITFAEWQTHIFFPSVGGEEFWSLYLRIGRFAYKSIYFWSPPVFVLLAWGFWRAFFGGQFKKHKRMTEILFLSLAVIIGMEMFYFRLPTEPSYLIPTIPFWMIIAGFAFKDKKWVLRVLLALVILANVVIIEVAKPDRVNQATGADFGVWIEQGHLVRDVTKRLEYLACGNQPCATDSDAIRDLNK